MIKELNLAGSSGSIAEVHAVTQDRPQFLAKFSEWRVVKESSGIGVELKQAAESVATLNGPALWNWCRLRSSQQKKVAPNLVVLVKMTMFDVFVQRPA